MKKSHSTLFLSLSLVFFITVTSCKKKSTPQTTPTPATPPAQTTNGTMTAKLNGATWTSVKNSAQFLIDDTQGLSALAINGETANDRFVFGIDFPDANPNIQVGNHDEGMTNDDAVMIYQKKTANGGTLIDHSTDVATFNITSVDNTNKKISGTFTVKWYKIGSSAAADSIYITNGVFTNISFTTVHQ